jgi:hypothetical protein
MSTVSIMTTSSSRSTVPPRPAPSHPTFQPRGLPFPPTSMRPASCLAALASSGCENCDIDFFETLNLFERFLYLWLLKDFIWIQNYFEIGLIAIGVVAFWWVVCLFSLLRSRKRTET